MHIAGRMFHTLKAKHQHSYLDEKSYARIRLAALLHDIGHSAFSHTTEEFYSGLKDIKDLIKSDKKFEGRGAGEVLSYMIITSRSFRAFFEQLKTMYPAIKSVTLEDAAGLIIGKAKSEKSSFERDIVSGPIDADKLDYFPRDGKAAGIDISLDIHRLINCVEIQKTDFNDNSPSRNSLVINRRGYNALQQLLFARATLTASVYHHHKVRACDCMIKNLMSAYVENGKGFGESVAYPSGLSLDQTPNFMLLTDYDFRSELRNVAPGEVYHRLLHGLFNRKLFKRILKISYQTLVTEKDRDNEKREGEIQALLGEFYNLRNQPAIRSKIVEAIVAESGIASLTKYDMGIDLPHKPNFNKAGDAPINTSDTKTPQIVHLKNVIPIDDWIKGYQRFFGHVYVFGPQDRSHRIKLAIASAKVLTKKRNNIYKQFYLPLTYESIADDIREDVRKLEQKLGLKLFR
jgi:uncharacterized protein